jgi:hypothetical protein
MHLKNLFVFASLFGLSFFGYAEESLFQEIEARMFECLEGIRSSKTDEMRIAYSDSLATEVQQAVNSEGCMAYPFSSITQMGILDSPDKLVRIFNWNVPLVDGTHLYRCFILHLEDEKAQLYNWHELKQKRNLPTKHDSKYLDSNEWPGALYYEIIPLEKGNETIYTLLGWQGLDNITTAKVLEVLQFQRNDIKLGAPIFKTASGTKKRWSMIYAEDVSASLKYYPKDKRIVFDHLSPRSNGLEGNYAFYGPDMSYDAFGYIKGKWEFQRDVYITMGKEQERRPYKDPRKR